MKRTIGFLTLGFLGLALCSACSSGQSSPNSSGDQVMGNHMSCQSLMEVMKNHNGESPIAYLESLATAAAQNGASIDQAAQCLDQNLQLQCSSESCIAQERN